MFSVPLAVCVNGPLTTRKMPVPPLPGDSDPLLVNAPVTVPVPEAAPALMKLPVTMPLTTEVEPAAAVTGEVSAPVDATFNVAPLATVVVAAVSEPLRASVPALTPRLPVRTLPAPDSVSVPVPTLFTLSLVPAKKPPGPKVPEKVVELLFAPTFIVPAATTSPLPDRPPIVVAV